MWAGKLASGLKTRAEVVAGFSQSREFVNAIWHDMLDFSTALPPKIASATNFAAGRATTCCLAVSALIHSSSISSGGNQRYADLERWDTIEMNGFGYASTTEVMTQLRQSGQDLIFADHGSQIIFGNAAVAGVFADMFIL